MLLFNKLVTNHLGKIIVVPKTYIRLAAVYRRFADRDPLFDFSREALLECYLFESYGVQAANINKNGYIFGKWGKDITLSMWKEDLARGDISKFELISRINGWWAKRALNFVPCNPVFGYL